MKEQDEDEPGGCLLTGVQCFLHRCVALRQSVLRLNQLHVHDHVGRLEKSMKKKSAKERQKVKVRKVSNLPRAGKRKIKWGGAEIIGVNDFLKAQEVSKEKL